MGNILGAPFTKFVTNQINRRQENLGKGQSTSLRDTEDILFQQSKTPWLRMSSGVNISSEQRYSKALKELLKLGFKKADVVGNNLAKNCVLQGGAASYNKSYGNKDAKGSSFQNLLKIFQGQGEKNDTPPLQNSGLDYDPDFRGAYGWGGGDERGLVPMPGITGANIKYINNGALSKTEITMKCYSKAQLAVLDMLYMRPGYTVLLEFGWSVYLDNKGNIQQYDDYNSSPMRYLFKTGYLFNQYKLSKKIREERKLKFGNYEGIYGKVSNFKWTLNNDGSYTCIVTLTGLGDMLESLKMNVSLNKKIEIVGDEPDEEQEVPLIANATKTSLNQFLWTVYDSSYSWYDTPDIQFLDKKIKKFALPSEDYEKTKTITIKNAQLIVDVNSTDDGDDADNASSPQVYITFGYLMAWIQQNLLLKTNRDVPTCAFDMNFESLHTDDNYFLSPLGQFSPNPLVCMIPFSQPKLNERELTTWERVKDNIDFLDWFGSDIELPETKLNNQIKKKIGKIFQFDENNGRLSQILLSINHLAKVLDEMPLDEDNAISLNDYLNQVLTDIQAALGGINEITMKLSDDGTLIRFIENSPNKFVKKPKAYTKDEDGNTLKLCRFVSYGFDGSSLGTIMKNIAINGSIPSNYSTLITIGAQTNGNQTAGNATTFSNYNEGLIDRIIPQRKNEEDVPETTDKEGDEAQNQTQLIKDIINKMTYGGFWAGFVGGVGGAWEDVLDDLDFLSDDINNLTSLHTQYIQALVGVYASISKQSAAPFFLPFELSFDIDGISGIYLHQKFLIDKKVLPPAYDAADMEILVKGVDHEITPSSWTTKIATQSVPAKNKAARDKSGFFQEDSSNQFRGGLSGF